MVYLRKLGKNKYLKNNLQKYALWYNQNSG